MTKETPNSIPTIEDNPKYSKSLKSIIIKIKKKNSNKHDKAERTMDKNDTLIAKSSQNDKTNDEQQKMEQTSHIATQAVIINKRVTNPFTLAIRPTHGCSNLNVVVAHRNVFIAMKMKESALKVLTETKTIDTEIQFLMGDDYTKAFCKLIKCNNTSRVYMSHKIKSAKSISELRYGNNTNMANIFSVLVENSGYLTHKQSNSTKNTPSNSSPTSTQELLYAIFLKKDSRTYSCESTLRIKNAKKF